MDTFENFDNNTPEESSENTPVQEGSEKPSVQENASAEPEQSQPEEAPDSHLYRCAGAFCLMLPCCQQSCSMRS